VSRSIGVLTSLAWLSAGWLLAGQPFGFPTANQALATPGQEEAFAVGTPGKPWTTGMFGCVRGQGRQFHEGLDIRCLKRDPHGEPADPIMATAAGVVVYSSDKPGLSNYGRYVVLQHMVEGLAVFSLYAHLREVRADLRPGLPVRAGEIIGTMGRSTNSGTPISKERAHLHFEIGLRISDRFASWHRQNAPEQRNDHGEWNGQNLLGLDPAQVLREQAALGRRFSLLRLLQTQAELCRVLVRQTNFSWPRRYAPLVARNLRADKEGIAGYELVLNYVGVPFQLIPRAASEIRGQQRVQLLSVNEPELRAHPCRQLLARRGGRWELAYRGARLIDLLIY